MCPAASTTTACKSRVGYMIAAISPRRAVLTGWVEENIGETLTFYTIPPTDIRENRASVFAKNRPYSM